MQVLRPGALIRAPSCVRCAAPKASPPLGRSVGERCCRSSRSRGWALSGPWWSRRRKTRACSPSSGSRRVPSPRPVRSPRCLRPELGPQRTPASAERRHRLCAGDADQRAHRGQVRLPQPDVRSVQPFIPSDRPPTRRSGTVHLSPPAQGKGTGVAYCVRTCDGFFFPLGVSTGSAAGDEAACANLCPASETRVYTRRIGDDMDVARSRRDGTPYAALPAAFTHRNSYQAGCSCTGKGVGLATGYSARYDQTLRVGDAVMTAKGVVVFNGGAKVPYRDSSFTALNRSDLVDRATRETLRRLEQASLPNASGFAPVPLAARPAPEAARLGQRSQRRTRADPRRGAGISRR